MMAIKYSTENMWDIFSHNISTRS